MVAIVRSTMMPPPRPVAALPVTSASVSASVACSLVTPEKSPWTNSPAPTGAAPRGPAVLVGVAGVADRDAGPGRRPVAHDGNPAGCEVRAVGADGARVQERRRVRHVQPPAPAIDEVVKAGLVVGERDALED